MPITELPALAETYAAPSDRILIIGAGYAGLRTATSLGKYLDDPGAPEVVLVDRHGYHQIITELPVAASGRLGAEEVALPLDRLLKHARVRFEQADVERIDLHAQQIATTRGPISYGTLVVAVGSTTAFYGVPGLVEHALTLKSVEDAETIKDRVHDALRRAGEETDEAERAALLSVLVGGAGLTGVELAGELAELLPRLAERHSLPPSSPRVTLVEAAPAVLPSLPQQLQARAAGILTELGIRLVLGSKVVMADATGIALASGDRLVGRTLVWTGGIMAPQFLAQSGLPTVHNGQVPVDEYLRAVGYDDVYVIGDAASIRDGSGHGFLNPTAQAAIKQGDAAAYNIVAGWEGWKRRPYKPLDKGQVISLGSAQGVADLLVPLTGRKVMALKTLIEEGYRIEITGRIPLLGAIH